MREGEGDLKDQVPAHPKTTVRILVDSESFSVLLFVPSQHEIKCCSSGSIQLGLHASSDTNIYTVYMSLFDDFGTARCAARRSCCSQDAGLSEAQRG